MIERAARVLKPGGHLVYATCSSEPEENEQVVDAFRSRHPEFAPDPPRAFVEHVTLTLDPGRNGLSPNGAVQAWTRGVLRRAIGEDCRFAVNY